MNKSTAFINQLNGTEYDVIVSSLYIEGSLEHDQINDALESRLCDLSDIIPNTIKAIIEGVFDNEDEPVCVCADCGVICEEITLVGLRDLGKWANCHNCDTITGVEFDSDDLPNGSNFDYQFLLRHWGKNHTPSLSEVIECLRWEQLNPPRLCPHCQDLRGAEVRINDLNEEESPDMKGICLDCVEVIE